MRSFGSLAWRQVRARRARALLTTAGIVLGVGMIFGVLLLSATLLKTFNDLYDSIYGRTDLVVSGEQSAGSLPHSTLTKVRRVPGVEEATADIFSVFTLVKKSGKASHGEGSRLNVVGIDPAAPDLSDSKDVAGRRVSSGREIRVDQDWADSQGVRLGQAIPLATPAGTKRFRVVGLFRFSSGLEFGGQGFGSIPLAEARRVMQKPKVYDEVDVVVAGGGRQRIRDVRSKLREALGGGVSIQTPHGKGKETQDELQAFNVLLYFFAGMALFVGGFLIFNAFNMTVLQRLREIGMLRTLGATRRMIARSVLREAAILGVFGVGLGLGLGMVVAILLVKLMRTLGFPIGNLTFSLVALLVATVAGLLTTVLGALHPARRAGRISPVRAILGAEEGRRAPPRWRAAVGGVLVLLGLAGVYVLAASDTTPKPVAAVGIAGVISLFLGIAMASPFAIVPLVRAISLPLRRAFPIEGRLAADSARSNPGRTAATTSGMMIGLALVVAFGSLGSSFLHSISAEFDRSFARDFTVQPRGFSPGQGPQQTIAPSLLRKIKRLPETEVVARERFLFTPNLPGPKRTQGLVVAFDPAVYKRVDTTDVKEATRDQIFNRLEHGQVSVGEGYADEAHLRPGDPITVKGPSGVRHTKVAGIVKTVFFGGQTVGMSIRTMRQVYGQTADSDYAVKATSAAARPVLERKIQRIVDRDYPNLLVLSNDELKKTVESQVNRQFGFFNAMLGAAIIISLFGIINTLSMSVIERTRELGVLRALGSSRWQVRRMIADESLVISLIGAVLGIAVGLGLGYVFVRGLAAGVPGVGYRAPTTTIAAVAVVGVVLGLLASILPARRAARLDVIEALSYE